MFVIVHICSSSLRVLLKKYQCHINFLIRLTNWLSIHLLEGCSTVRMAPHFPWIFCFFIWIFPFLLSFFAFQKCLPSYLIHFSVSGTAYKSNSYTFSLSLSPFRFAFEYFFFAIIIFALNISTSYSIIISFSSFQFYCSVFVSVSVFCSRNGTRNLNIGFTRAASAPNHKTYE